MAAKPEIRVTVKGHGLFFLYCFIWQKSSLKQFYTDGKYQDLCNVNALILTQTRFVSMKNLMKYSVFRLGDPPEANMLKQWHDEKNTVYCIRVYILKVSDIKLHTYAYRWHMYAKSNANQPLSMIIIHHHHHLSIPLFPLALLSLLPRCKWIRIKISMIKRNAKPISKYGQPSQFS